MKKDCILLATLPSFGNFDNVERTFACESIAEVRFNTGAQVPETPFEIVRALKSLSEKYDKKLWVDVKGRQLKVVKWADPLYSCVEINHKIHGYKNAVVCFRNGEKHRITNVIDGDKIFVDPLPCQALGAGQSINVLSGDLEIEGYLTEKDKEYLVACNRLGVKNIMASFVESFDDLAQIARLHPKAKIVSKIESLKGVDFVKSNCIANLMAARDDLYIQSGQSYSMFEHLKTIIQADPEAICASRIFLSLERRGNVDFADFADLELMYRMGYRKFMLCDNVCNYAFDNAIRAWKEFVNG